MRVAPFAVFGPGNFGRRDEIQIYVRSTVRSAVNADFLQSRKEDVEEAAREQNI